MKLSHSLFFLLITFTTYSQSVPVDGKVKINGANLYLHVQGKGEPLLVIHGGPGLNHSYFRPHLDGLAKNYKLIYYDQRACGKSDIPAPDSISMNFFVEDIEAIRKHLNVDQLNILAHSWASLLATQYAIKYPDRVKKLIYSNPAPLNHEYDEEMTASLKARTSPADSIERASLMASTSFDENQMERFFKLGFKASSYNPQNIDKLNLSLPENFLTANRALYRKLSKDLAEVDFYDEIKLFTFPVLIINGKADAIPKQSLHRMREQIPQAQLLEMEKSGHFPFLEEPKVYLKEVRAFLKKKKQ